MLPTEILIHILEQARGLGNTTRREQEYLPELLSHVCRQWRRIALSTPLFWTHIETSPFSRSDSMLDAYLERSKDCPVDVHYHDDDNSEAQNTFMPEIPAPAVNRLIDKLIPHIHRCRRLYIATEVTDACKLISGRLQALTCPALEQFVITVRIPPLGDNSDGNPTPFRVFAGGAPLLSSVTLQGISVNSCFPPMANVTSLVLADNATGFTTFHKMISTMPALTSLSIEGEVVKLTSTNNVDAVQLRSLTHLRIAFPTIDEDAQYAVNFCGLFVTPKLDTLDLDLLTPMELSDFAHWVISAGYPLLRSLRLRLWQSHRPIDKTLFAAFPRVSHVDLGRDHVDDILQLLVDADKESPGEPLWPSLTKLDIFSDRRRNDVDVLCSLVSSRQAIGRPLQAVCISCRQHSPESELCEKQLSWLRERIELSFFVHNDP
jgi:hypothetical protein